MKHTKGPWEVLGGHRLVNEAYWITNIGVCGDEVDENARLIAAAPDLLEACKVAVLAITHDPINPKDVEFIEAVIAKAEI